MFTVLLMLNANTSSAELAIEATTVWCNVTMTLDESVRITSTGFLCVANSTIQFNCTSPLQYGITVDPGGRLEVVDGDGDAETTQDASRLLGSDRFFLVAKGGSALSIFNSMIINCGASDRPYQSGLEIHCSNWTIGGTVFRDSYGGIAALGCRDGSVIGCTFDGLEVGMTGVELVNITVTDCTFTNMGTGVWLHMTDGLVISRCEFVQIRTNAIHLSNGLSVRINGCVISGCRGNGVYLKGSIGQDPPSTPASGSEVDGCVFNGVASPVVLQDMRDVSVRNCSFRMFTNAFSMWGRIAMSIIFEWNVLAFGGIGVDCGVETCQDLTITNNTFSNLTTAMQPLGDRVQIEDNTISDMRSAGIRHTGNGVISVIRNTFVNCTYAVRIERDLSFDPGMVLRSNRFMDNRYGLMARDVSSLMVSNNSWTGGTTAAILLNLDASGISGESISSYDVGYSLMAVRGTIQGTSIRDCAVAILSDLGTRMAFDGCDLSGCALDAIASNGSLLILRDIPGARALKVLDEPSEIQVEWTVSILLLLASTDQPAVGIPLALVPYQHEMTGYYLTGTDGRVGPIIVPIGRATLGRLVWYNPYGVDVEYGHGGHVFEVTFEVVHIFMFRIDDIPPFVELFEPSDGTITSSSTVHCRVRIADENGTVTRAALFVDGQFLLDVTASIDGRPFAITLTDGGHDLLLVAEDAWSNSCNLTSHIIVDTRPPRVVILAPLNGSLTNTSSLTVSGIIEGQSRAFIGSRTLVVDADGHFESEVELPYDGQNTVEIHAIDEAGNVGNDSVTVIRDTVAPTITIDDVPALTIALEMEIGGTTDGDTIRCITTNETIKGAGPFVFHIPVSEGMNHVTLVAWDLAGNSATISTTFLADHHVEFHVVEPPNGATVERSMVRVNATGEPGLSIVMTGPGTSKRVDATGDINISLEIGPLRGGLNRFEITVSDEAGNTAAYTYLLYLLEPPLRVPEENPFWYPLLLAILVSFFVLASFLVRWRRNLI